MSALHCPVGTAVSTEQAERLKSLQQGCDLMQGDAFAQWSDGAFAHCHPDLSVNPLLSRNM
eukprot:64445-Pelagomonas_calceolata.AAC.1